MSDTRRKHEELRRRAEITLDREGRLSADLPHTEVAELLHELQVHQIELELQNEDLRKTQAELSAMVERLATLFHSSPVGYLILDEQGFICEANHTFCVMVGRESCSPIGRPLTEFFTAAGKQTFLARYKAFFKAPRGKMLEVEVLTSSDKTMHCRLVGVPLKSVAKDQKNENRLLVSVIDVTEQKRAEDACARSEHDKTLILQSVNEMIVYMTPDLVVRWMNRVAADLARHENRDLIGLKCHELWHQSSTPCLNCPMAKARETLKPQEAEVRMPDGRCWLMRVFPVFDEDQKLVALAEFGQDISERKRAEQEQEKLREQLQQAQKLDSIGRLAGGIAHDFNNMLMVILGHLEESVRGIPPESALAKHLTEAQKAAKRSADFTRQLLGFARKQMVQPRRVDVNETVWGMLKMLHRLVGEGVAVEWAPGNDVWPILIDPSQIDQILANLVVNSRDAMKGQGKVRIETRNCSFDGDSAVPVKGMVPGDYVQIAVIDWGCGMDAATRARIFEPFFTTKELGKGTGLGLAVTYGIVKQNQGEITVESEPGAGASFRVFLPRLKTEQPAVKEKGEATLEHRGRETVLLVEDEPEVREVTRQLLERFGYTVLLADTPEGAIEIVKTHQPMPIDLLITDVIMPEMNGKELSRRVLELKPGMKILFMSGYPAEVIADQGIVAEGLPFIQKPFPGKRLGEKIREVMDEKPAPSPVSSVPTKTL